LRATTPVFFTSTTTTTTTTTFRHGNNGHHPAQLWCIVVDCDFDHILGNAFLVYVPPDGTVADLKEKIMLKKPSIQLVDPNRLVIWKFPGLKVRGDGSEFNEVFEPIFLQPCRSWDNGKILSRPLPDHGYCHFRCFLFYFILTCCVHVCGHKLANTLNWLLGLLEHRAYLNGT
jgi:hypothetical protein